MILLDLEFLGILIWKYIFLKQDFRIIQNNLPTHFNSGQAPFSQWGQMVTKKEVVSLTKTQVLNEQ